MREYQICNRCIMDTTDPDIQFDDKGNCSHCNRYFAFAEKYLFQKERGQEKLQGLLERIKKDGKKRRYDCILGVSGGVDSTFLAYKLKEFGLRPLAVHLDNGWNSELAVANIEKVLNKVGIDLYTHVLDWEEFKDLQIAFLKASTPNSEIPTDHAINGSLFRAAIREKAKYILRGSNIVTERILPGAWSQGHSDWKYIKSIHKQFGTKPLKTFPYYSLSKWIIYRRIYRIEWPTILDFMDYNKSEAMDILQHKLGWIYYGGKHYESIYTRFFQGYILPFKFGFDKRRAHMSTLICSGQMKREQALEEIAKDPYPSEEMKQQDREYVIKKLGLTEAEFDDIMNLPPKKFEDYPSYKKTLRYKMSIEFYLRLKGVPQ